MSQPIGYHGQLGACPGQQNAGLQPANAGKIIVIAVLVAVFLKLKRLPELRLASRKVKIGRHNPNHGVGPVVEGYGLSQDAAIAAEFGLPECVAQ